MTSGPLPGVETFVSYTFDARNRLTSVNGPNVYRYGINNPTNTVDPDGRWILPALAIGFGVWAMYEVYDAFSDLSAIENVGINGTIGAPGIQEKVGRIKENVCKIANNVPGTSITGPGTLPGHAFPIEDVVDATKDLRRLSRLGSTQNIASRFNTIKSTMTDAGYDFVHSTSSHFGGYFRRPKGNPNNLPSPKEINAQLDEFID
jgi:hypothetical protein